MNKEALHAHQRGQERLNLSQESVNALQRAADRMWFSGGHKKLTGTHYYSQIRDPHAGLLGYAVYKKIGNLKKRPRLILASILDKNMQPKGQNISHFFNTAIHDNKVKLKVPKVFPGFKPISNNTN